MWACGSACWRIVTSVYLQPQVDKEASKYNNLKIWPFWHFTALWGYNLLILARRFLVNKWSMRIYIYIYVFVYVFVCTCSYFLIFVRIYYIRKQYTSLFPTNQTIGFTAPTCFGCKPQPSSGRYKCWRHLQCDIPVVEYKWLIIKQH